MHTEKLELRVANLDCEHDAANIERGLAGFSGLAELKVYPKSASGCWFFCEIIIPFR